jgi:hypothetical protein
MRQPERLQEISLGRSPRLQATTASRPEVTPENVTLVDPPSFQDGIPLRSGSRHFVPG